MSWLKAQLHLHIQGDPVDNIKYTATQIINYASQLNYDVLCVTCHDKLIFRKSDQKLAKSKGILLIPGIEKTIQKKHVLIINAHPESEFINSFADLKTYKKEHKHSLIIAPHPFHKLSTCLEQDFFKYHDLFDGLELSHFNSRLLNFNKKTQNLAKQMQKSLIATGDVHYLDGLNYGYCFIKPNNKSIESIIEAIKNGLVHNYLQNFSSLDLVKLFFRLYKETK